MPQLRRSDQGFVASSLAIALISLLLGTGAAVVAVKSVVTSYGANDTVAVQTGPSGPVDPAKVITYGG